VNQGVVLKRTNDGRTIVQRNKKQSIFLIERKNNEINKIKSFERTLKKTIFFFTDLTNFQKDVRINFKKNESY